MKPLLYFLFSALLLLSGTSCSRSGDATMQNPRNYKSAANRAPHRENDRRQYKQTRGGSVGLGIDTKANNPYQFRTVKAPKKYKYTKGRE
ncbi:hypothetical protein [Hymenobacter sp. CRA2]|uniref:hypothetical protein n=1 Tax=Hymenobacter sp. CRA2 TaxID=1955620 RepID=UPI00098F2403|nr:hypothetical protein [Hymenobacter sp. CRA2]OON67217.1 hypothetical protein B0919_19005 [Hymenobacter sp. CRA2]